MVSGPEHHPVNAYLAANVSRKASEGATRRRARSLIARLMQFSRCFGRERWHRVGASLLSRRKFCNDKRKGRTHSNPSLLTRL